MTNPQIRYGYSVAECSGGAHQRSKRCGTAQALNSTMNIATSTYWGKQLDSTAAALRIILSAACVPDVLHLDCLTTRPFACRCPKGDAGLWLAPLTEPWEGVLYVIDALGLGSSCRFLAIGAEREDADNFFSQVADWMDAGPVLLGPCDRYRLWDRVETRYYRGGAHFVVLVARMSANRFCVHDPEGFPYVQLPQENLFSALKSTGHEWGALQVHSLEGLRTRPQMMACAFEAGVHVRKHAAAHPEASGAGIQALVSCFSSRAPRRSEEAALHFALSELSLARFHLAEFFRDFSGTAEGDNVLELPSLLAVLDTYGPTCANALEELRLGNVSALVEQLRQLANQEFLLDEHLRCGQRTLEKDSIAVRFAQPRESAQVIAVFERNLTRDNDAIYSDEFLCRSGTRAALKKNQIVVALADNTIVAALRFYKRKRERITSLYQFAIDVPYRGRGLLMKMLALIRDTNVVVLCPRGSSFNTYYEKTGWTLSGDDGTHKHWSLPAFDGTVPSVDVNG